MGIFFENVVFRSFGKSVPWAGMDYNIILEQTQQYVRNFFSTHVDEKIVYHDSTHTEQVVRAVRMIAQHYQLSERDFFIVNVAAWFHDSGYFKGGAFGHEGRGAEMASAFLAGTGVDEEAIQAIRGCILATQIPQKPSNLLEDIVCDGDLFHLGTDDFPARNKLMRKEMEASQGKKINKDEWRRSTIRLMETHHYHTDYCRLLLNEKKQENLDRLREKEGIPPITDAITALLRQHDQDDEINGEPEEKEKKKKKKDPGRGIDTVFRITSNNNQKLSSQADSKAHIMIQVNSIIISVLLSLLLRKIEDHTNLAIPATILLVVNLVTIIFSILATRPHIPPGTFSKQDLDEKKVNLLFFGNFYKMSLQEYAGGMLQMMDDRDFLYGSLIRDVYFQGIALGNKYRWLRLSYNTFMYGLIVSVLAFMIAALAYPSK
jgi:predicted metal-dependent HD superfamily phosphohydrolase